MSGVVNTTLLEEMMKKNRISIEEISKTMGMDRSTFYRKLKNGGYGFTVKDVHAIRSALKLSDEEAMRIFFAHGVA